MAKRRVVVTGLGIVCPTGVGVAEAWGNIVAGQSGIAGITRFDASPFASQIAGEVKNFDVTKHLPAKEARRLDTFIHYGLVAANEAIHLDPALDYGAIGGLSNEMVERLSAARPETLGQASRIQGVTPAALTAIMVHSRRRSAA